MQYIEPVVGLVAFLSILVGSFLVARRVGTWQAKARVLMSLCGTILFALILYGEQPRAHEFRGPKMLLAGMTIGIFVALWLEGSLNVMTRPKGGRVRNL